MISVGAYEAKTRLPELLRKVEGGDRIVITRHDRPVARLVPADTGPEVGPVADVVRELRAFRRGRRLAGVSLRSLIAEGRR